MSSNLSTESPVNTSGNAGTGGTLKELKTDFANLLINRVTLGECLNVIRDACVARAADLVDEADEPTLENIKKDVSAFQEASTAGTSGGVGSPIGDGTGPVPDATGPDATGPDFQPTKKQIRDMSTAGGPRATGPDATGPDATGPDATGPDATGPTGPS